MISFRTFVALKEFFFLLRNRPNIAKQLLASVKLHSWVTLFASKSINSSKQGELVRIDLKKISTPVYIRNGTSDFYVLWQVLGDNQYADECLANAKFIIDAGSNIGLASLFFLNANPNCEVIAVEPDPENCAVANRNLAPYKDRCRVIQGAIWSRAEPLVLSRGTFRDGGYWATQTLPASGGFEPTVNAYTMSEIAKDFPRIDFLKMDIEGAELNVFRDGDISFLERTNCCAVECHDDDCLKAFTSAVLRFGFVINKQGEVTYGRKPKP